MTILAGLFHREHVEHEARINTLFSSTSYFDFDGDGTHKDDDERCCNCGHSFGGHYDYRCPIQHKE